MPFKCSVPYCRGNYDEVNKVTIYRFPTEENLRNEWIKQISRKDFEITKNSRVSLVLNV